jgi:DNA-binding transcriptional LysR family regulator
MIHAAPWPGDWKVRELADEWIGPVVSPRYPGLAALQGRPASALAGEALLHTASRRQAWPAWATQNAMAPEALRMGTGFEHLYYLLEAAVAGLGVAIAPQQLVAEDLETGRLLAPWGFIRTDATWCLCSLKRHRDARVERLADWLERQLRGDDPTAL